MNPVQAVTALVLPLLLVGVWSCRVGSDLESIPAATSPHGVQIDVGIRHPGTRGSVLMTGELLTVSDSAILVEQGHTIVLYPFSASFLARFEGLPTISGSEPDPEGLDRLRQLARHPHGLTSAQLEELLRIRGQDSLHVRRP